MKKSLIITFPMAVLMLVSCTNSENCPQDSWILPPVEQSGAPISTDTAVSIGSTLTGSSDLSKQTSSSPSVVWRKETWYMPDPIIPGRRIRTTVSVPDIGPVLFLKPNKQLKLALDQQNFRRKRFLEERKRDTGLALEETRELGNRRMRFLEEKKRDTGLTLEETRELLGNRNRRKRFLEEKGRDTGLTLEETRELVKLTLDMPIRTRLRDTATRVKEDALDVGKLSTEPPQTAAPKEGGDVAAPTPQQESNPQQED